MEQLRDFADNRLLKGCIYCGGAADTRDHVPSRVLLETPYPENLPVVGSCQPCNNGFSKDEEYLACLLECVFVGSTDPSAIKRPSIAKTLMRSTALRERIEGAKRVYSDRVEFTVELERIRNVILKLARGHAAFELSADVRREPDELWWKPLDQLTENERGLFDSAHAIGLLGEIGSRASQRLMVIETKLLSPTGQELVQHHVFQDWVDVQDERYRYFALDDAGGIIVLIVIAEILACKVVWLIKDGISPS